MQERLQKILAHAGVASRRKAEQLIAEGRVELNGQMVKELGTKADPRKDLIRVDGKLIADPEEKVWFVLYKPAGVPEGHPRARLPCGPPRLRRRRRAPGHQRR